MKRLLLLVLIFAVSGCITSPFSSRDNRINAYIKKNPDVSPEVISAIRDKLILTGMTMEQVSLAWGEPGTKKVMPAGGNKKETIWYYYDAEGKAGGLDTSSLFAVDVPSRRITFSNEDVVGEWKVYDEELETSRITAVTKTLPTSVLGGGGGSEDVVRAGNYYGWPYIILSTTMGKGESGAAVLNGQIVGVGESMKGVTLLAVGSHGVKLQYNNQIGILKKGESTQ